MTHALTGAFSLAALALVACAGAPVAQPAAFAQSASSATTADYNVSDEAMRTAIRDASGSPVGLEAYDRPGDAVRAGDIAAFIAMVRDQGTTGDGEASGFAGIVTSLDAVAADDIDLALERIEPALDDISTETLAAFLEAWYLALDGRDNEALSALRDVDDRLPGLTGDLALAAMLEGFGRTDEAIGVYSTITPSTITAPEHEFDPQGLVFSHVKLVIARQTLLLRQQGEIEEAKSLYRRLAEAQPEEAVSFEAALESIETGRGIDDGESTVREAFSRSLGDYSLALSYQRLIRMSLMGQRRSGLDETKSTLDQLALLITPDDEELRLSVIGDFYDEALFEPAAHIAAIAPEPTAMLRLAEAQAELRLGNVEATKDLLAAAQEIAEEDEQLSAASSAMSIYALLNEEDEALAIADDLPGFAESVAEEAMAHGASSAVYTQFARPDKALFHAREARQLDDTHDRRMVLANAMADAGEVEDALRLIRNEALARPNDPYMLNTLGYFLVEHTEDYSEAFKVLARAVALAPNDPYIADSFGWAHYRLGNLDGAARYIEKARSLLAPQGHWEIEDHLGDIYWHQDKPEKAREAWRRALEEYPEEDTRQNLRNKLENGIDTPAPERQPLPDVSLGDDGEITRRDI